MGDLARRIKERLRPRTRLRTHALQASLLGRGRALRFALAGALGLRRPFVFRTPEAEHPLLVRSGTSDFDVFRQIFVEGDYAFLADVPRGGLIVDCGANVGYSSAYFLSRFPDSELIAIEPDPGNFELLSRNLAAYGSRARAVQAGLWSHRTSLVVEETAYRDGREWTRMVRESRPGDAAQVAAVDVATLLRDSRHERIALLKVDIEGAEAVVFADNYESWLDAVDVLAIELHDDSPFGDGPGVFQRAIAGRGFSQARFGELTVCTRSGAAAATGSGARSP
jgi:FkbM family methyltransferase